MFNANRKHLGYAAVLVALAGLAGTASAETTWQKNHPRRTQVNHRLDNQDRRIHQDVKNGTLTKSQAASLHHKIIRCGRKSATWPARMAATSRSPSSGC